MTSPSSTSNSEAIRIRPIRELAVMLVAFLVVEVVVRVMVGAGWLGPPLGQWPRRDYPVAVELIEARRPDVLAVGNSRAVGAFDPALFTETIREETGHTITAFNGGHGGTGPELLAPLIRYLYMPATPDTTIILTISPLDMGGTNPAWNAQAAAFLNTPELRERMDASRFNIRATIDDIWYTYAYRHSLGDLVQNLRRPPLVLEERDALGHKPDPFVMNVENIQEFFMIEDLAASENYPKTIDGPALDALLDLMQHAEERLILVNIPAYISILPGYEDYAPVYDTLWPQIEDYCAEYDITCWDFQTLVDDGTLNATHFANPTHLNADGAVIFTRELAWRYSQQME